MKLLGKNAILDFFIFTNETISKVYHLYDLCWEQSLNYISIQCLSFISGLIEVLDSMIMSSANVLQQII